MSETSQSTSEKMKHLFMLCNCGQNFIENSAHCSRDFTVQLPIVQEKPLNNPVSIVGYDLPLDLSIRSSRILNSNCEKNDKMSQFNNIDESSMPNSEKINPYFIKASMNIDSLMVNKTGSEFSTKSHHQRSNVKMDELLSKNSLANSEDEKLNIEFESKVTSHNNEMVSKLSLLSEISHRFSLSRHIVHNSIHEYEKENMPCTVPIKQYKPNQQLKTTNMPSVKVTRDCTFTGENKLIFNKQVCHGDKKLTAKSEVFEPHTTESIQPCFADTIAAVIGPSCSLDSERTCAICRKKFGSKKYLKLHYRIHSGEISFACNICQQKFTTKSNLKRHIQKVHGGDKLLKCEICGNIFSRKKDLKNHVRIHKSEKPNKCDICGKLFGRKYALDRHILIHLREKSYKCDNCGRMFARKDALDAHIRTHTGEKPFKCDVCRSAFTQKPSLLKHVKRCQKLTLSEKLGFIYVM